MSESIVIVRDPGWVDQLVPIAIGSVVTGGAVGSVVGWMAGVLVGVVVAALSVLVVARFFERRTLMLSGTSIVTVDSSGRRELNVADLTSVDVFEVFHVGKRVEMIAPRTTVSDLDPGSARPFLLAVGQVLHRLGKEGICTNAAKPFLGL